MALDAEQIRQNFQGLRQRVDENDGLLSVTMRELREAIGAGRLDVGPINFIKVNLQSSGLASTELSRDQSDFALIYNPNRPAGRLVRAAAGDREDSDRQLQRALEELLEESSATSPSKQLQDEIESLRDVLRQVNALVSGHAGFSQSP